MQILASPEQTSILNQLYQVKNIRYVDKNTATNTIVLSLIECLKSNESSIIVCPDEALRHEIYTTLFNFGFERLMWRLNTNLQVTDEDLTFIRTKTMQKDSSDNHSKLIFTKKSIYYFHSKLGEILTQIHGDKEQKGLKTIIDRLGEISEVNELVSLDVYLQTSDIEITESEFDNLIDEIHNASKLYHPKYNSKQNNFTTEHFILSEENFQNDELIEKLKFQLKNFLVDLKVLRDQYYTKLKNDILHEKLSLEKKYVEEILQIQNLKTLIEDYTIKSQKTKTENFITSLFQNQNQPIKIQKDKINDSYTALCQRLKNLNITVTSEISLNDKSVNEALMLNSLAEIEKQLLVWLKEKQNSAPKQQKFINKINHSDKDSLEKLESNLTSIIQRINQSKIFIQNFELNTLSTLKQGQVLDHWIMLIQGNLMDIEENIGYYRWQSFINLQSSLAQKVIEILKSVDTDHWTICVEQWYLRHYLEQQKSPFYNQLKNIENQLLKLQHEYLEDTVHKITEEHFSNIDKNISALKDLNPSLHNLLFKKKKTDGSYWKSFFERNTEVWSKFFKIVISENDQFGEMSEGCYQHIFYIDYLNFNPDVLNLVKTIHSYFPFDLEKIEGTDLTLMLHKSIDEKHLSKLSPIDKLNTAKKLAKILLFTKPRLKIFQLKNANIISCLSNMQNEYILEYFDHLGIKEIKITQMPYERIVDCFIETDRSPFLLLEEGLINPLFTTALVWQLEMVQLFAKCGFNVQALYSSDLILDYRKTLDQFCANLNFKNL